MLDMLQDTAALQIAAVGVSIWMVWRVHGRFPLRATRAHNDFIGMALAFGYIVAVHLLVTWVFGTTAATVVFIVGMTSATQPWTLFQPRESNSAVEPDDARTPAMSGADSDDAATSAGLSSAQRAAWDDLVRRLDDDVN